MIPETIRRWARTPSIWIPLTVVVPIVVWIGDSLAHALVFGEGSWVEHLVSPAPAELLFRSILTLAVALALMAFYHMQASEDELVQSERRFREIAERLRDVFWVYLFDEARFEYVSPSYREVWGRDAADLRTEGRHWYDHIHPADQPGAAADRDWIRSVSGPDGERSKRDRIMEKEYRIRRPDGSIRWIWERAVPILDDDPPGDRIIGVATDVTDWKQAEQALRTLIRVNQVLVESQSVDELADLICAAAVSEGEYRLAWVGLVEEAGPPSSVERILRPTAHAGHDVDELNAATAEWTDFAIGGKSVVTAILAREPVVMNHIEPSEPESDPWKAEAVRNGYSSMAALPLIDGDRTFGVLVLYEAEPDAFHEGELEILRELASEFAYGLRSVEDRTRARSLEDRLHQAQRLRSIGRLVGGIAHDFNNHLTVIRNLAALLMESPHLESGDLEDVADIKEAADRSASLTGQLLSFSRQQPLRQEVMDVNCEIESLTHILARVLGERIEVDLELGHDAGTIFMDRSQFEQILMNLAVNAGEAMQREGRLSIGTRVARREGELTRLLEGLSADRFVHLWVEDDGCGMDEDTRERIFDPFFTTTDSGTGLGLSTVFGIVRQNRGAVFVDSELGRGTRFDFYFPQMTGGRPI